ncbi:MAG: hypothetical protein LBH94_01420 [Deltaproteobacteria bacterium]|nr:hypothetical protein [Deltaproteobacteria bacterium]
MSDAKKVAALAAQPCAAMLFDAVFYFIHYLFRQRRHNATFTVAELLSQCRHRQQHGLSVQKRPSVGWKDLPRRKEKLLPDRLTSLVAPTCFITLRCCQDAVKIARRVGLIVQDDKKFVGVTAVGENKVGERQYIPTLHKGVPKKALNASLSRCSS